MTSHGTGDNYLEKLERANHSEISSIERAVEEVQYRFTLFRRELSTKETEILSELTAIRQRLNEKYLLKRKSLFDVYQNREIFLDFDTPTYVEICWKKEGLGIHNICKVHTSKRSMPTPNTVDPYGELQRILYKVRHSQSLLDSIDMEFPPELHSAAKNLMTNPQYKYPILDMYEWIHRNLRSYKSIVDIQHAIHFLSKYAMCLFYDPSRTIFHTIKIDSNYYQENISSKIQDFDSIMRKMDFQYNAACQSYTIKPLLLSTPHYLDKLAAICCELLLAFEELVYFRDSSDKMHMDAFSYFKRGSSQSSCLITDPIDSCASNRDACITEQTKMSFEESIHSSPGQSINYTPNSSISDSQFHSAPSSCNDELFQSQAFGPLKDIHEPIPKVQPPMPPSPTLPPRGVPEFTMSAYARLRETDLYSIPDSQKGDFVGKPQRPETLTQSVMIPKVQSCYNTQGKYCPKCNSEIPINSQVCLHCRAYFHF